MAWSKPRSGATGNSSDAAEFEVKPTGPFAVAYDFSNPFDMAGYSAVDITIKVSAPGTSVSAKIKMQTTSELVPTVWQDVPSDDNIASGISVQPTPYITDITPPSSQSYHYPRRGRWMRVAVLGTVADGAYSVTAMRHV